MLPCTPNYDSLLSTTKTTGRTLNFFSHTRSTMARKVRNHGPFPLADWTDRFYEWFILSIRRRAKSDIPTGPRLAACGDEMARNVAFTAPLMASVFSFAFIACDGSTIVARSVYWGTVMLAVGRAPNRDSHGCRRI